MKQVALIYNPASGQHSLGRLAAVDQAMREFERHGIAAEKIETTAPGSAGPLALQAVQRGCDSIIACGGDGTVHEILQSLVGTDVAIGILPLGTANALAINLGLPRSPIKAIRKLIAAIPTRVSVGRITYQNGHPRPDERYFIVAAGIGADALFLSNLDSGLKRRFGYILYLIEAFRVWATHSFPLFEMTVTDPVTGATRVVEASQLLVVRIRNFGGVLHDFVPGASILGSGLRLIAFKTRSRLSYLRFLLAVVFRRQTFTRDIELLEANSVQCRPRSGSSSNILAEADGELLGHLPARLDIVPQAVNLLIPAGARP